jgi:hypothetical protein
VIVNFRHDPTEAIEGLCWAYRGGWLTLKDAAALKAGQPPAAMIGEVVIHRSQISYTQVLP